MMSTPAGPSSAHVRPAVPPAPRPVTGAPALRLDGRVALVTGATRGLGLAIARKLCASGCDVRLVYSSSDAAARRAEAALTELPGRARAVKADVTEPGALARLTAEIQAETGGLDIFVHNAASLHPMPALGAELDSLHADLATGLDPLLTAAPTLAAAMAGRPGRIVAVSSLGARRAIPRYVGLGVTKAALESLVRYLAVELAPRGITVNAVSTAKLDKGPEAGPAAEAAGRLAARTPAGRLTTPEDVADAVALLCTDEAGWIQGQVITVDGGLELTV